MSNRLQDATDRLSERLQSEASRTASYRRCGEELATPSVTFIDEVYEVMDPSGARVAMHSVDCIIARSDLSGITSMPGDQIVESLNGVEVVYEVTNLEDRDCCENYDTSGLMLVMHTHQVE